MLAHVVRPVGVRASLCWGDNPLSITV